MREPETYVVVKGNPKAPHFLMAAESPYAYRWSIDATEAAVFFDRAAAVRKAEGSHDGRVMLLSEAIACR